jgi:predicted NBD/HSP70 family sugar kinase
MAARAEQFSGAARKVSDFALISLGRGVGSALSFSGRLYSGASGQAGEIRELIVPGYDGKTLTTLEDVLSEKSPAEYAPEPARLAEICAPGLGQLVSVTDPSILILSGRFSLFPDTFIARLQELLPAVEVRRAQFGRDSGACGSAVAAIEYAIFNPNNRRK